MTTRTCRIASRALLSIALIACAGMAQAQKPAGLPGFDYTTWFGVVGPAGMPPAIVNALNQEINRVLNAPEMTKMLLSQGTNPMTGTPEQFREAILSTLDKTEKVLKATGIKLTK